MTNPYEAPESEVGEGEEYLAVVRQLKRQQSYFLGILLSAGLSLGILFYFATYIGKIPMFVFLSPGFAVGLCVKVIARPFSLLARIIPALISSILLFVYLYLLELNLFAFMLPLLNFLACLGISRRLLNHEQEAALYKLRNKI